MSSDPTTPYFACIPLAWTASEAVSKTAAQTWFARHDLPASVLLGASHLLATDERPVATRALEKLAKSDDPQVASLAQTQLWRLAFRIQSEELDRWRQKLETLPEPLRAGPCFLFGTALLGEQRYEEAALVLMRVPILYEQQRDLSAASLVAAGDALLALGRDDQAVSLWRQVLRKHPQTQWKADAELRLERTTK